MSTKLKPSQEYKNVMIDVKIDVKYNTILLKNKEF